MARYSKDHSFASVSTGAAIAAGLPNENAGTTPANPGTATGAGDEFVYVPEAGPGYEYPPQIAWSVVVSGGTLTTLTVNLEASDDGVNWFTLDTNSTVTGGRKIIANTLAKFLRANIATYVVASGTPVVTTKIIC